MKMNAKDKTQQGTFIDWQGKRWIKAVALAVIAAFLWQDVAWAIPDIPLLNPRRTSSMSTGSTSQTNITSNPELFNRVVAESIHRFLSPLADKPLEYLQISDRVTLDLTNQRTNEPTILTKSQLDQIYAWLKDPQTGTVPCSAYVLYNLLEGKGIDVQVEELSTLLLIIDILAGNIQPPTNNRQKDSLTSLRGESPEGANDDLSSEALAKEEGDEAIPDTEKWEVKQGIAAVSDAQLKLDGAEVLSSDYQIKDGIIEYRARAGAGNEIRLILRGEKDEALPEATNQIAYSSVYEGAEHCIAVGDIVKANQAQAITSGATYDYRVILQGTSLTSQRYTQDYETLEAEV
ncbi:MAG: hypothetical protein KKA80_03460, partial [Candidatus Omnitrophica bacterium]|nr:hypothetical protein [Candidatus Omnitrophota bacterium]